MPAVTSGKLAQAGEGSQAVPRFSPAKFQPDGKHVSTIAKSAATPVKHIRAGKEGASSAIAASLERIENQVSTPELARAGHVGGADVALPVEPNILSPKATRTKDKAKGSIPEDS